MTATIPPGVPGPATPAFAVPAPAIHAPALSGQPAATPAPGSHTESAELPALLQRLRAGHARQPPDRRQRDADLQRLRALFVQRIDAMVAALQKDFGRRSRHEILASEAMTVLEEIDLARRRLRAWMRPQRRRTHWAM